MENKGWECPKCGKVFAPHVQECYYCNAISISGTITVTSPNNDGDWVYYPTYPREPTVIHGSTRD